MASSVMPCRGLRGCAEREGGPCMGPFCLPDRARHWRVAAGRDEMETSLSASGSKANLPRTLRYSRATGYRGAMEIRVEYQEGLEGEPEPAVVWFGERRLVVQAITDRWYGTDRRWWELQTEDGLYVLRRDDASGEWEVAAVARS